MKTKKAPPAPITAQTWVDQGLPEPRTEARVCSGRRWRVDYLWQSHYGPVLAVEVHGGMWSRAGMGHNTSPKDFAKGHRCTLNGWHRMEFTPTQVRSGYAAAVVKDFLFNGSGENLPPDPEDRRKKKT